MLKKISFLTIIVALATGFCACNNDNDEPSDNPKVITYIIGKWQGVSSSGWEKVNGKIVDTWNNDDPDFEYIEFKMDATGESEYGGSSESFSWYINDDSDLVIGEKYVGDGTGDTYKIKILNKDKMILLSEDNDPKNGWYQEDTYIRINY